MRILYLADIRFPLERANGIQSMETCHALARRGHDVHMVVRRDTEQPPRDPYVFYGLPRIANLGIELAPVKGPSFAKRVGYLAFAAGRSLGAGRPDVVLTRDLGIASFLLRLPPALRPPVVYESHGYAPEVAAALPSLVATAKPPGKAKLGRLARREALVFGAADGYVTITRALAGDLEERFGRRERLVVVPDGVRMYEPDGVRTYDEETAASPPPARPLVAYAGHLYAWKGVDVLLEALARVPEADGLIVGGHEREPDLERVRTLAGRLGISGRVTFTGHVAPPEVRGALLRATILVLPNPPSAISTRFTSPLKLFEYMAAGRPIVASDLPSFREVLRPEETALLVTPGDAAALADGLRRIIADPALGSRLSASAHAAARDYTWDRRAERLEALLSGVTGGRA